MPPTEPKPAATPAVAANARQVTSVETTKRLPAPAARPPLVNAKVATVIVDVDSRTLELRMRLTSDDGARSGTRVITIKDGESFARGAEAGDVPVNTEDGFEGLAAATKAYLAAVLAQAEALGLL